MVKSRSRLRRDAKNYGAPLLDKRVELSLEETAAIRALKRLAKRWPKSLWLFSASGRLCVMRNGPDGRPVFETRGGVDPEYKIDTIEGIHNDGGDW